VPTILDGAIIVGNIVTGGAVSRTLGVIDDALGFVQDVAGNILGGGFALISGRQRSFDTLIPDVVVREVGRDELVITEHPVERGAAISDHAFVRPVEIEMTCGWSDSTAGYVGYIDEVYAELIALQKEREPFDVTSGKRTYENMLLAQVLQQTDERSENILMVTARFREVLIVSTETTSAPNSAQSNPSKTGSTQPGGTKQLKSSDRMGFASPSARA
jgi:hypothetical protein